MNKLIGLFGHWFLASDYKQFNEVLIMYPHITYGDFLAQLDLQGTRYKIVDKELKKILEEK